MKDVGYPFSQDHPYENLIKALETSLIEGVEQPTTDTIVFRSSQGAYELSQQPVNVKGVTGMVNQAIKDYTLNQHFTLVENRLVWKSDADQPPEGSRLIVSYTYRASPSGLTDFNAGSVIGTLIRAFARELGLTYQQMDQVYRRAFIDLANGVALDNVVALLGLERNPAVAAKGSVIFFRKKAPDAGKDILIQKGLRVADRGGRLFETAQEAHLTGDMLAASGRYEVSVPVVAVNPGPEGNVLAEAISVMPTPPRGVDGVTNPLPLEDGTPDETDEQLRLRAKHHLERLGKGTLTAIKYAILEVDGVESVEVNDHTTNSTIPLGEVHISYSGGDPVKISQAVEITRPAGVMARLRNITEKLIGGLVYLLPAENVPPTAAADFKAALVAALKAQEIGKPLSVRKLNALAYSIPGLAEVAEAQFSLPDGTPVPDPLVVELTEVVRPNEAKLEVHLLTQLQVAGNPLKGGAPPAAALSILSDTGQPASFTSFELDLTLLVEGVLKTAPEQAPDFLGTLSKKVTFAVGGSTAALEITADEIPGSAHDLYATFPIQIKAVAYPGLGGAETNLTLP